MEVWSLWSNEKPQHKKCKNHSNLRISWDKVCPNLNQAQGLPTTDESNTADKATDLQILQSDIHPADI